MTTSHPIRAIGRTARLLAVVFTVACLAATQAAPAHAAAEAHQFKGGRYFNKTCVSRINCTYYLRPQATRSVTRSLDAHGWSAGLAADLICFRLPFVYGLACGASLAIPYQRALPHLKAASDQGGCFTIRAKLPIARFGSVTTDDPACS